MSTCTFPTPRKDARLPDWHKPILNEDKPISREQSQLYFLSVGDANLAHSRGYNDAQSVYNERLRWALVDVIDINLTFIPSLEEAPWLEPSQIPICGTAAYIAAFRGHLPMKFRPNRDVYWEGILHKAHEEMDIPILHHMEQAWVYRRRPLRTAYKHYKGRNELEKWGLSFVPSRAEWSRTSLPPTAGMIEPLKVSEKVQSNVQLLVHKNGDIVTDRTGQHARRAFDHILLCCITFAEWWLVASWLAEDPRLTIDDIMGCLLPPVSDHKRHNMVSELKGVPELCSRQLDELGYQIKKSRHIKGAKREELRDQCSAEQVAVNTWWFVEAATRSISQQDYYHRDGLGNYEVIRRYEYPARWAIEAESKLLG